VVEVTEADALAAMEAVAMEAAVEAILSSDQLMR